MTNERPSGDGHEDPLLRAVAEYWDDIQRAGRSAAARTADRAAGRARRKLIRASTRAELTDILLDVLPPRHPLIERLLTVPAVRRRPARRAPTR